MNIVPLYLKNKEDRHLKQNHLWIYSNQIDVKRSSFSAIEPGTLVNIYNNHAEFLGLGYVNPHTLLCARILTRHSEVAIGIDFFKKQMQYALLLRERIFSKPFYRLIYSEGDYLPGLIVDRFGDYYVCEVNTAGMEHLTEVWLAALIALMQPKGVLLKNDKPSRLLEHLPLYQRVAYGDIPETVLLEENNLQFYATLLECQKTGWYYDQRDNRQRLTRYCRNRTVLDAYSYTGSFGVYAAYYGASQVTCVESSAACCEMIKHNAALNQVTPRVSVIQADAVMTMKDWVGQQIQFDIVLIDPPAFVKRRKDKEAGLKKYAQVITLAVQLVKTPGFLLISSCSMHVSAEDLLAMLKRISVTQKKRLQIIEEGFQAPDHPIHPSIPETAYLSTLLLSVINSSCCTERDLNKD